MTLHLLVLGKFEPRLFEINPPDEARLVFPGDSLTLICRVSVEDGQNVRYTGIFDNIFLREGGGGLGTHPFPDYKYFSGQY